LIPHAFRVRDPVTATSIEGGEDCWGNITRIDEQKMVIGLGGSDMPEWIEDGSLTISMLFDTKTYEEGERALSLVLNAEKGRISDLREVILGNRPAVFRDAAYEDPRLNDSQNEAIRKVLGAEDVTVIHGPPGTGKTTTIVAAIAALLKTESQVLACAPSNAAVDHLCRGLIKKNLKVARIGHPSRVDDDLVSFTIDRLVQERKEYSQIQEYKRKSKDARIKAAKFKRNFGQEEREQRRSLYQEARELMSDARKLESFLIEDIIDKADVITSTLVGAAHRLVRDRHFQTAVIDEAGQALQPLAWIPVTKADRIVLAGDHFQLPPTVKSYKAADMGLDETLLDKTTTKPDLSVLLTTQYRMNNDIMAFSNQWFYNDRLKADELVENHGLEDGTPAVEFIDTAGCGFDEKLGENSLSRHNPDERDVIIKHARQYQPPINAGIISPYREQVELLKKAAELAHLDINTVDSFQGQERDIIYVSLVRSNPDGEIGFLKDYRRMNVAMTRARKKLVVIGDSATIGNDPFFSAFVQFCEERGFYRSAWELMY
jgi:superfamily I DNA and/or RNA helicase